MFVEVNRGINDMNHSTQTKWIDPETGQEKYSQPQDSKTNFDYHEGILWSTNGGSIQNWNTQRNLFYQGQLFCTVSSVSTM